MKHLIPTLTLVVAAAATPVMGAVPAGYYDSLNGKKGLELKKAVKELVADHEVIPYGEINEFMGVTVATWTVFAKSDVRVVDGQQVWWDMYSSNKRLVEDGHAALNIEHSVANSWWGGKSGSNAAYCDLHHLVPSDAITNNSKGDVPLGVVANARLDNGVSRVGSPASGTCGGASMVFEPADVYKGDFARNYFYIFTVYDNIPWKDDCAGAALYDVTDPLLLKEWASEMLLDWAASDPVSHKETDRNDVIYAYQLNRNPFVDCPELADHIWGSKQNEPFQYTAYTPADDPDYPLDDIAMLGGYWRPISSADELNEDDDYFIVSPSEKIAMTYSIIGSAMDAAPGTVAYGLAEDPEVATGFPEETAIVRLEKGNGGWYVGVYDPDRNFKGYISVTTKNSAKLNQQKANGTLAKISVDREKTSIVYTVSDTDYTLLYNSSSPRFAAYASAQKPIRLYRATDEFDDDDPAGIDSPALDNAPLEISGVFDLQGRKVGASLADLRPGIYIVVTNRGVKKIKK